jgi:hypothetical protein
MPAAVIIWVWSCAYLNCAGWALSALHQLNVRGYAIALLLWFFAMFIWRQKTSAQVFADIRWQKISRRFRKPFPAAFLILAAMAFLGGAIYAPNNFDALTYRVPRVLHWLAENQWYWIHTPDARMNTRACGMEWLSAPLLALTRSDRLLFLINVISFLFLPGLVFSVFTRLGVRRRVAWYWMWLLPAGFNFVLQAGSVANDLFGSIFALAAMDFALRAIKSQRRSDVWLSILAAGLLTGSKASNLPLLLPWFVALLFSVRLSFKRPIILTAVALMAFFSSFLPNAILNVKHCGDWTGSVLEQSQFRIHQPLLGLAGNGLDLGFQSVSLPVMPLSRETGQKIARGFLPQKFLEAFDAHFEAPFGLFWGSGIQTEDGAGLGFGISFMLAASLLAVLFCRGKIMGSIQISLSQNQRIILLGLPWISLLAYMANAGMGQVGRLLSPYYALLLPLLLAWPVHEQIVRQRWWRWSASLVFLLAFSTVVLTPARPLFPAQTVLKRWGQKNAFLSRAETSYVENARRNDGIGSVRALIPPEIHTIGFVSHGNDIEPSLWQPYGQRRVEYILPSDTAADARQRGIQYVVVAGETLAARGQTFDDWVKNYNAEKVGHLSLLRTFPPYVAADWYVAKLQF